MVGILSVAGEGPELLAGGVKARGRGGSRGPHSQGLHQRLSRQHSTLSSGATATSPSGQGDAGEICSPPGLRPLGHPVSVGKELEAWLERQGN